jgi:small subunit ribosomal protein S21
MARIDLRENEPIDRALRKFKTQLRREGIMDEVRSRESYEKPSQRRRRRKDEARRREFLRQVRKEQ